MATAPILNPLSAEHCQVLDNIIDAANKGLELAAACKDCGWEVSHFVKTLHQQKAEAEAAKRRFFPECP